MVPNRSRSKVINHEGKDQEQKYISSGVRKERIGKDLEILARSNRYQSIYFLALAAVLCHNHLKKTNINTMTKNQGIKYTVSSNVSLNP